MKTTTLHIFHYFYAQMATHDNERSSRDNASCCIGY